MVVKINELSNNTGNNSSENSTVAVPLDNSIQPTSLDSNNTETVKKDSVMQLDDASSAVRTSNNQESFTRIPGWSFMSNSLFTNLLRAKETEETPVLHYESTRADKMRSRKLYRQMNKQSNTILSEQINGYCGDKPINDIVEYIEGIKSPAAKKKAKKGAEKNGERSAENKDTSSRKHTNLKSGTKNDKNKGTENVKVTISKNINSVKSAPAQEKRKIKSMNKENNSDELKHDKRTVFKNDSGTEITKSSVSKKDTTSKSKSEKDGSLPKQTKMKNNDNKSSVKQGESFKVIVEKKTNSSAGDNNEQNKENKAKENDKVYQASKVKKAKNANK